MSSVTSVIEASTRRALPENVRLSGFMMSCFHMVHRVHRAWFWCRRINVYSNPDNFLKLAAGRAVNWLAGDKLIVRVAAHAVLIASRILEVVEDQRSLVSQSRACWFALTDRHALPPKTKWRFARKASFLSPSTKNRWVSCFKSLASRIVRFVKALFSMVKHLFTLSMKMMDAVSAFSFNSSEGSTAVNEMFVNCADIYQKLSSDREALFISLKTNKALIKNLLQSTQSVFTFKQLTSSLKKSLQATEKVNNGIHTASQVTGKIGKDMLQRVSFGFMQAVGLSNLVPRSWVPSLHAPWMEKGETSQDFGRFPPMTPLRSLQIQRTP